MPLQAPVPVTTGSEVRTERAENEGNRIFHSNFP